MKNLALLAILSFVFLTLSSQDYTLEYGKVTRFELEQHTYIYDKEASAAVLYDIGETNFIRNSSDNFDIELERSKKIKIYKESGFNYGVIEIPYYHEGYQGEEVKVLEASTYNLENGNITRTDLDKSNIYQEDVTSEISLVKFAMPNIKEGSVIEIKYLITSPYLFNYFDWEFQQDIPVKYSNYKAHMIPFYSYTYLLQGADKFDDFKSYAALGLERQYGPAKFKDMIYEFMMDNIPAFIDEGYITSKDDYVIKLDLQLTEITSLNGVTSSYISTWQELAKKLLKHPDFGSYIEASRRKSKTIANQLISISETNHELIENISDYVKNNFNWDRHNRLFPEKDVKEFLDDKKGNSANLNLYMLGLLLNTGLDAKPVILSTRDHGKIKADFPFTHFFNYVVVLVEIENKKFILDATEPILPYYLVPSRCLNDEGLVLQKKEPFWIQMQNVTPSESQFVLNIKPNPDSDSLEIKVSNTSSLYEASRMRNITKNDASELTEYIEEKGITLSAEPTFRNYFEKNKSFQISYEGSMPLEHISEKLYVAPFLTEPIAENPFKIVKRQYPVDLTYARKKEYNSFIEVPEGYQVEHLPDSINIDNVIMNIIYKAKKNYDGNNIMVHATYTFKKPVYNVDEYSLLRYYLTEIIEKFNERISFVPDDKI